MFARDSFTTTYSGPIVASGESLRKQKSDAEANRAFVGNQRAYRPQRAGIRAGGAGEAYRSGMMAAQQFASAPSANNAAMARRMDDQQALFDYQSAIAEEQDGLRRLLLDTDQTERTSQNALRKDKAFEFISSLQRQTDRQMGDMSRGNNFFGVLGSILS
jgi:hypothetical protein